MTFLIVTVQARREAEDRNFIYKNKGVNPEDMNQHNSFTNVKIEHHLSKRYLTTKRTSLKVLQFQGLE